ncbi:MAG: hypothetical protein K9M11_04345 [Candidatus Pacebacteria bacterium]|nr:hypothetical protein [Candidatus Paceibacterota bacterium]
MEKDITNNQEQMNDQKKDIQVYEAVSSFIKDKEGIHIYRRAEKICKAYFLLTQHIQDNDSLKLKLRTLALDMSSKTLDLVASFNKTEDLARDVAMKSMALVSVSDIAVSAHSINTSNYNLMVNQVQIFIEEVETYWKTLSYKNQAIPTHLFEMDTLDASYKNSRTFVDDLKQDNVLPVDKTLSFNVKNTKFSDRTTNLKKDEDQNKKVSNPVSKIVSNNLGGKSYSSPETSDVKNERQTLILNTIKNKGESSIKDLTEVIKGCSEKTIQRELISLVGTGDLLKTGERRWSRYSLSQ